MCLKEYAKLSISFPNFLQAQVPIIRKNSDAGYLTLLPKLQVKCSYSCHFYHLLSHLLMFLWDTFLHFKGLSDHV